MPPKKKAKGKSDGNEEELEEEETYITFAMVRELLITQERLLKAHYQELFNLTNSKVDGLTKQIDELKISLEFTQKEVVDLKTNCTDAAELTRDTVDSNLKERIKSIEIELNSLKEKTVYMENQSRRNNIRIDGIPESSGETWEDTEKIVKKTLTDQLDLSDEVKIERAHRVGRVKSPGLGRSIVCKLYDWKLKENIIQSARKIKPPGLFINEDFAIETMLRRKELTPDLKRAREQGRTR